MNQPRYSIGNAIKGNSVNELVLSLFPGVGLLDCAFAAAGFVVVQAADKITGGDIRDFAGIADRFDGIVAGPPCQGFSVANAHRRNGDHPSVVNSREMLQNTCRVITECQPAWFLIENVPCVPDVRIAGYSVQRIPITDQECGGVQLRSRHIQFGSCVGAIIRPKRVNDYVLDRSKRLMRNPPKRSRNGNKLRRPKPVTTKTDRWTDFPDLCRKQGLDEPLDLPGWYRTAKFKAVGNGVPLRMGRVLAAAVAWRAQRDPNTDCQCDCGRTVSARALTATPSCRKRKQLAPIPKPWVDIDGWHDA